MPAGFLNNRETMSRPLFVSLSMVVKNEETVLGRALESFQGKNKFWDELVITDTGSTDATMDIARRYGARVVEAPWPDSFGAARNMTAAHASPQADLIANLDADEVLGAGGHLLRQRLEEGYARGRRMMGIRYEWSHDAAGKPTLVFSRQGFYDPKLFSWCGRVHEALEGPPGADLREHFDDVTLEHWPKPQSQATKSSRDLHLLELDAAENPANARCLYYLGREYGHAGRHREAIGALERYLAIATWRCERMHALHLMAASEIALGDEPAAVRHFIDSIREQPERREPYMALCRFHYDRKHWRECAIWGEATCAIAPESVPRDFFYPIDVYSWLPHDLLAIAYWNLGEKAKGKAHLDRAIALNPADKRLLANRRWFANL